MCILLPKWRDPYDIEDDITQELQHDRKRRRGFARRVKYHALERRRQEEAENHKTKQERKREAKQAKRQEKQARKAAKKALAASNLTQEEVVVPLWQVLQQCSANSLTANSPQLELISCEDSSCTKVNCEWGGSDATTTSSQT